MTSYYPLLAEFRTLLNQLADEDPANKHAKSLLIEHFKEEIGTVILSYFLTPKSYAEVFLKILPSMRIYLDYVKGYEKSRSLLAVIRSKPTLHEQKFLVDSFSQFLRMSDDKLFDYIEQV
mmetsp:Transcript_2557/g.3888  ORF Transcript_2557/g.3888 Transcript_2557/m.3888 type:complete len:120 (-) Transcript_2557:306-665(-)